MPPAMPRPPIPIAAARPRAKRPMSGKENLLQLKQASIGPLTNVRSRRERPCDACRRRKSRCVIREGAVLCVLCEFHKQDCTFLQSPQPRKRKLVSDEKNEGTPKKRSTRPEPQEQTAPTCSSTSNTTSPPRPSHNQSVAATLRESLGLQRCKYGRYIGLTTPLDSTLISLSYFDTRNESNFDLGTLRRVNDHECFIMFPDETSPDYGDDIEALKAIEQVVGPHGDALVDLYFQIVHPSFPIVQQRLFRERIRNGDRQVSPPLLAGVYILALNWWSHDPALANLPKPDARKLDDIASRSLAAAMQRPKLSTVQAGLLLLQRPEADSWSLTTQLVAIGQELGLHLDCSTWSIPHWERGLRKRVAWALYMQDKWSSLIHGRPSHIFGANWAVKPIDDEDFNELETPTGSVDDRAEEDISQCEKGQVLFAQMIALTNIMAEVMDTFYTQVAIQDFANAGKNSTRLILERAKPVQIKLKEWFASLPPSTKMDNVEGKRLSSTGYLHLAYFATEITLHRRIIQSLDPSSTTDAYLTYICRSAAKTRLISAMDFVNRLKPAHLQAFWYFASKINFTLVGTFGSLLWATAPAQEEADFYRTRLREYRWTLSVSSARAAFLGYAVQMLDASRAMLNNLAAKPSVAQGQVSSVGVPAVRVGDAQLEEQGGVDVLPPLSRYTTSASTFSGFSTEALNQYGSDVQAEEVASPGTPPSSV